MLESSNLQEKAIAVIGLKVGSDLALLLYPSPQNFLPLQASLIHLISSYSVAVLSGAAPCCLLPGLA